VLHIKVVPIFRAWAGKLNFQKELPLSVVMALDSLRVVYLVLVALGWALPWYFGSQGDHVSFIPP
jgi:hypothetical protein